MTNLGAGFSVGSTETSGPAQQSSSGLASERDRYTGCISYVLVCTHSSTGDNSHHPLVFSSRHLMPPPTSLRVNGVRHQLEDRRIQQAFVGKDVILWIDKSLPKSRTLACNTLLDWPRFILFHYAKVKRVYDVALLSQNSSVYNLVAILLS
ncbi:hypothetical protein XENORESO_020824 [Xenotaenia resolanae]|uniref:Uncharacterized protein n=1 Tax=Xenotaenia resolanae TaxID=208358 RepID=A0ABV0VVA1_9TELE